MLHLKATKTSFYKLIEEKTQLIPEVVMTSLRKSRFWKAFRRPDYFLEWRWEEHFYRAFLAAVCGTPLLTIERYKDGEMDNRQVIWLPLKELQDLGMVKEVEGTR